MGQEVAEARPPKTSRTDLFLHRQSDQVAELPLRDQPLGSARCEAMKIRLDSGMEFQKVHDLAKKQKNAIDRQKKIVNEVKQGDTRLV